MMASTIYQRFLLGKFCSSAAANLDLRLAKHQQDCLVNECSHMEEYAHRLARTSSNVKLFVRFCIRLGPKADLRLSSKQLLCLHKECIKVAQYYGDVGAMEQAILIFVSLSKSVPTNKDQNECEEAIAYGKKCIDIAKKIGVKSIERDACYVVGKTYSKIKKFQDAATYSKRGLEMAMETSDRDFVMHASLELGRAYAGLQQYTDAIYHMQNCIEIGKETGNREVVMYAHFEVGQVYAVLEDYVNATIFYKRSIEVAKTTGNGEVEMYAHLEVGRAYAKLKEYENTIISCNISIAIAKATGTKEVEMNAHLEIGRANVRLKEYENTIASCKIAIVIAKETGDREVEMNAYLEEGRANIGLKDYGNSIISCTRSIEMAKESGSRTTEMYAHLEVARAYEKILDNEDTSGHQKQEVTHEKQKVRDDAILHGVKCADIAKETGDKETEADANFTLMAIHKHFEQYDEAIACGKKSIEIAEEFGGKSEALVSYVLVTNVLQLAGRYQESLEYGTIALEISTHTCDSSAEMALYLLLGDAYKFLKQSENSIFFFKKCIEKSTKYEDKRYKMCAHLKLAERFISVPLLDDAIWHVNKGKRIAQELNSDGFIDRFREVQCLLDVIVGTSNQSLPKEQVARELFNLDILDCSEQDLLDAIDRAMATNDIKEQSHALLRYHCFCHSTKKYIKALTSLKSLKKVHLDKVSKLWCDRCILNLYMSMKQFDQALAYCWEILSEMKESGDKVHQSLFYSMFGQLLYRHDQFNDAEKYLREALQCFDIVFVSLGSNDKLKMSIIDKYFDCYKCLSLILSVTNQVDEALLVSDGCRARALKDRLVENFGMKKEENEEEQLDIQAFLESSNDFILFYSLFSDGILLFVSEANENTFKVVFQEYEMCEKSVRNFLKLIDHVFDQLDARQVGKCENRLLDTNQDETEKQADKKEELIYEPTTDALEMDVLQWATGPDSRGERSGDLNIHGNVLKFLYQNLIRPAKDYLDQDEVVVIPDGPLNCVPFAALQDPDTGKYLSETKRIRLAPSIATLKVLQERLEDQHHRKGALVIGSPLVGTVMMDGEERDIEPLFGALDEAIDIAALLGVRPLVAANATKPAVLEKLQQGVSVVHIAAHGILSKATIVLAPSTEIRETKPIPDEEDYMLTMADVQQAQVRAQLVVLSCCHSGRGEIKAEGVVGMCRAFLASGARAVVASLWAIDDEATLQFMKTFYGYLKDGKSASRSLHLTMHDMRQSERFNKPKYWAPFFLIGDDVTIDFTD